MLSITSPDNVYESMAVLAATRNKDETFNTFVDLEFGFHNFLEFYQPDVPRVRETGTHIIKDSRLNQKLADLFAIESALDDKNQSAMMGVQFDDDELKFAEQLFFETLDFMQSAFPDAHFALSLVIDSIFLRKSEQSGGGSTSNAIGVIWLNSRSHWSKYDLIELLVHELTHNMMFIDEVRYLHYSDYDLILDEKNFSQSAILHTKRPLDKVVHSIVVATELLLLRENYIGEPNSPRIHPPSEIIKNQTLKSCQSLVSMPNYKELTTDRCKFLVDSCLSYLNQ